MAKKVTLKDYDDTILYPQTVAGAVFDTDGQPLEGINGKIGDLDDAAMWGDASFTLKTGYYRSYSTDAEVESEHYQYAALSVSAGQTYKVTGFNANANIPLAYVKNSQTSATTRLAYDSDPGSMTEEVTIPANYDTLYVNGYDEYPVEIKFYNETVSDILVELESTKVDKAAGKVLSSNDYTNDDKATVTTLPQTYMTKKQDFLPQDLTIVDGYFVKYDKTQSQQSTGRQYTSLSVTAGEVYKISGYNLNTNFVGCFVEKENGVNEYYVKDSDAFGFLDEEITILNSGTMYINGLASVQSVGVKKYSTVSDSDFFAEIDTLEENVAAIGRSKGASSFKYNLGQFVIASKYTGNPNYDLVQVWTNCLQGSLKTIFTFYRVLLMPNTSDVPNADVNLSSGTTIFQQTSDCILATRFNSSSLYNGESEYSSGAHAMIYNTKYYKTAESVSVDIYVDGKKVSSGDSGMAEQIDIVVKTDAYDPFVLLESLEADEDNPTYETMFVETMNYRIVNGSIHCIDSREYKKEVNLEAWGGFASMSFSLGYGYFPCGVSLTSPDTDSFGELNTNIGVNDGQFYKRDYPDFTHFLRRNSDKSVFEVVYLTEYGIGDHEEIPQEYAMCWIYNAAGATGKKVYHRITYHKTFHNGDKQRLSCIYGWFVPIVNTTKYIVYRVNDLLFFDIKEAYSGTISLPCEYALKQSSVERKSSGIVSYSDFNADGIDIVASSAASLILKIS